MQGKSVMLLSEFVLLFYLFPHILRISNGIERRAIRPNHQRTRELRFQSIIQGIFVLPHRQREIVVVAHHDGTAVLGKIQFLRIPVDLRTGRDLAAAGRSGNRHGVVQRELQIVDQVTVGLGNL